MNVFKSVMDKYIKVREAQAEAYVNDYLSERGFENIVDLTIDPRG